MRNLKRALSLGLAAVMVMGMMIVGTSAKSYTDSDKIENQVAVEVLGEIGVMVGNEDGSFAPDRVVTRAEMAVILTRILYGNDLNVDQFKGLNTFTDVPDWAEGFVNLCASLGIVAGRGDGIFDPNATVTTAEAALMLSRALGYFQNPAEFGGDWALAAVKRATQANIIGGDMVLQANEGLTRDDVAQMTFNTLTKAVPVQYNELLNVYYNENKGITYALTFYYTDTLGYKNFDLVYRTGDKGDYGRPSTTWGIGSYQASTNTPSGNDNYGLNEDGSLIPSNVRMLSSDEIITVAETPDYVYTKNTNNKTVYNDLGTTAVGFDWTAYVDGAEQETAVKPVKANTDKYGYTDKGAVTEIYVNKAEEKVTVVEINYYLAEVTRDRTDDDGKYITVKAPSYGTIDESNFYTDEFVEGDYVVITVDVDTNDNTFVATAEAPKTMDGVVEAVDRSTETKDTGYAVIDDVEYEYSINTIGDVTVAAQANFRDDPTLNAEYRLYLDPNGYVIGYVALEDISKNYLAVLDSDTYMSTAEAKVMLPDGTIDTVTLNKRYKGETTGSQVVTDADNGGLKYGIYSYSVDSKGVYTLGKLVERVPSAAGVSFYYDKAATGALDIDQDDVKNYTTTSDSFTDGTVLNIEQGIANMKNSGGDKVLLDLDTVFVDTVDEVIYTGYDETASYDNANVAVVYDNKDNVADIVFILGYENKYNADETYFYVADWTDYRTYNNDGEYVVRNVYVDGELVKMELSAAADATIVTVDSNGDVASGNLDNLYKVVKTDGDRVIEIEVVDADDNNGNGQQNTMTAYHVAKGDKGTNSFETAQTTNEGGRYTWDNDTTFVTVTQDGSHWKVTDGSASDIYEWDSIPTTEGDVYSYVYVADANSKNEASLVYIFNYEVGAVDPTITVTSNPDVVAVEDLDGTAINGTTVAKGSDLSFTVEVKEGCSIVSVKNGTKTLKADSNGVYTIENIKSNVTINITTSGTAVEKVDVAVDIATPARVVITNTATNEIVYQGTSGGTVKDLIIGQEYAAKVTFSGSPAAINQTTFYKDVTLDYYGDTVYFVPTAADETLQIGTATYDLTLATNVNATWTYKDMTESITGDGSAKAVPADATVTLSGTAFDNTSYLKVDDEYLTKGVTESFTMDKAINVTADKYHKVDVTIDMGTVSADDLGNQTLTAAITNAGFDGYIKEGDNITVTFDGITTAIGSTKIQATATASGATLSSSTYQSAADLIQASGTSIENSGTDTVSLTPWTNADVTITYTLSK